MLDTVLGIFFVLGAVRAGRAHAGVAVGAGQAPPAAAPVGPMVRMRQAGPLDAVAGPVPPQLQLPGGVVVADPVPENLQIPPAFAGCGVPAAPAPPGQPPAPPVQAPAPAALPAQAGPQGPQGAGSRVVRTTGTDIEGPFTRLDVRSGEQVLETTLRGNTLHVDWVEGPNMIFNLGEVQTAAGGPGSIRTIRGYVTDQLAVNVQRPGHIQRLAEFFGRRLGGQWTARLETIGNRTYLILERRP